MDVIAEVIAADQIDPDSTPADGKGDDYATVSVTPLPKTARADLSLQQAISNQTPEPGSTIMVTNVLINDGPDESTGASVKITIPDGLTYMSHTVTQGTYAEGRWAAGRLASGARAVLAITLLVGTPGTFTQPPVSARPVTPKR